MKVSNIQYYLSTGYLYLIIVGIAKDAIYYGLAGVNIMAFSGITDVLLSPIVYLVDHVIILAFFSLAIYWILIQRSFHFKYRDKSWYQKWFSVERRDKRFAKEETLPAETPIIAIAFAFLLIGASIGDGLELKNTLDSDEIQLNSELEYIDGSSKRVMIVGQNSNYIFFVEKDQEEIAASPINGTIRTILKRD